MVTLFLRKAKLLHTRIRMSFFALDVRPSNYEASASANNGWVNVGPYIFAVVATLLLMYSFIRVEHPERKQFEYRLRPFRQRHFGGAKQW